MACLAAAIVVVVMVVGYKNPEAYKSLGAWGDFTGGLLNPVLTFFTFIAVLLTITLQRIELGVTRDEIARSANALEAQQRSIDKQNFETTFFEMLKLHNSIVNSIDIHNSKNSSTTTGRDCFETFYKRLRGSYQLRNRSDRNALSPAALLREAYKGFWSQHQIEMGHYFRFLFNFVRLVDGSVHGGSYHMKLLRSQLSDQELLLLFYNTLSPAGAKFKPYAEKHALFDNLPISRLLDPSHVSLIGRSAFGANAALQTDRDGAVVGVGGLDTGPE